MKIYLLILLLFASFIGKAQVNRYDVIIDEIMADPNPAVQLPSAEYIELKNRSSIAINLGGWSLSSVSSNSGPFPSVILKPDSFVIVTSISNVNLFTKYGNVIGLSSFPPIVNTGTTLSLHSSNGRVIHSVSYTNTWYDNSVKSSGGWSLEMIDCNNPCSGISNWKASIDDKGGTPGHKNSVDGLNSDQTPPKLIRSYALDSVTLIAVFNEPLDSTSASVSDNYLLSGGIKVQSAQCNPPLFNSVYVLLSSPLSRNSIYELTAKKVSDCSGNEIGIYNTCRTGIAIEATNEDIRINEVLFNPRPQAYDYIEIFNSSRSIIDASKLYIAKRDGTNQLSSVKKLSDSTLPIFPGDYFAITENQLSLEKEYLVKNPDNVIELTSLPSFPDTKGDIVLMNSKGNMIDELSYSSDWQFPLISNPQGVALERIDPFAKTQSKNNWHSASSTSGYGTPTYMNSQYKEAQQVNAELSYSSKAFSPDNDGINDFLRISYKMDEQGYVANLYIFDSKGRMVRYLIKNNLLGLQGSFTWDGLDDLGKSLSQGPYVILTEIFNLQGKKRQWKEVVSVVRK
jgi:hypothetical protein